MEAFSNGRLGSAEENDDLERTAIGKETATTSDEAPLQLAAVQLSHCVWGLHVWGHVAVT